VLQNPQLYTRQDSLSDGLLDMMAENGLSLLLPPETITFPRTSTTIDLVWGNKEVEESIVKCQIAEERDHGSDHYPIEIELSWDPLHVMPSKLPYNYEKTDWEKFTECLQRSLPPVVGPTTPVELDSYASDITSALQSAVKQSTPRKNPCPFSKRWWTEDLTELRTEANRRRNRFRRTRNEIDRQEWKAKQKEYQYAIRHAKESKWREFLSEADDKSIFIVKKYIDSMPTISHIPMINGITSADGVVLWGTEV